MTAVPKDFELAIRSSHDIPCSPGYEIASPPRPAVLVGLIIAAFAMGIVAIQISAYSSRFWKEHKLAVIFVKGLYLYNLVSLGILCQALYRWSITGFRGGNHNHANHEVARRYALVMIPGVISRSVVSCVLGVVGASLFHSGPIALMIHISTASEFGLIAFLVHCCYNSFGSSSTFGKLYSLLLRVHNSIAIVTECLGLILFCRIVYQRSGANFEGQKPTVNMKPDELILSYSLKLAWYIAFECSMWSKSPFMTACFGIPLGAVCSITVLSLLHAYPSLPVSAFLLTAFQDLPRKSPRMAPVVTIRDVTIESCHDGPREIQLMERLNTLFPEEEEIRSYQQEPEDPTSENGIFEERAKKSQLQAFAI